MRFSQNHTATYFFFKNEARMLKFGLVVPLYSITISVEQILEFLIIFGDMSKIWTKLGKCLKFWT